MNPYSALPQIPHLFGALQSPLSPTNWVYYAEKSTYASRSMKRGSYWPRGKMLGGSGGTNLMYYIRGNDRDYDNWERFGNPGWGWTNALHYFKKSEAMQIKEHVGEYHGKDGPMRVTSFLNTEPIRDVLFDAARELGYKFVADINANEYIGMTSAPATIDNNRRASTAHAFLKPAKNRPNLKIIKNAHATRVVINEWNRVTGVEFILQNRTFIVPVRNEAILSAGTVNTPQILMLSGVGPRNHLHQYGIESIVDLPVGGHLEDHTNVIYGFAVNRGHSVAASQHAILDTLYKYVRHEVGSYGNSMFDVAGFFNTVNRTDPHPDIEICYLYFKRASGIYLSGLLHDLLGLDGSIAKSYIDANKESDIVMAFHVLLNPKSKGRIELRSSDPFDAPRIHANYLTHDDDVKTLIRGLRLTQDFMRTTVLREHNVGAISVDIPECAAWDANSDEYYECYVRHMSNTLYHPTGTAKMGPKSDSEAVVDAHLRVKGIKNLRVADASIMPKIPSGHTNAAAIMIGEKAADMIKEDWPAECHTE